MKTCRGSGCILLAALCLAAVAAPARAHDGKPSLWDKLRWRHKKEVAPKPEKGEPPPWHKCRIREWPGRLYYGRGGPVHSFERAGNPHHTGRFAHTAETPNYCGYYVGGGSAFRGGAPGPADGTFGWDYCCFRRYTYNVFLKWTNRYQGGIGAYEIDGPPVTDVGPIVHETIYEGPKVIRHHKEEEH